MRPFQIIRKEEVVIITKKSQELTVLSGGKLKGLADARYVTVDFKYNAFCM